MKKLKKLKTSIVRSLNPNKKVPITFDQLVGEPIGALIKNFAKSDDSDLQQYIEEKKAFNQQCGIEM